MDYIMDENDHLVVCEFCGERPAQYRACIRRVSNKKVAECCFPCRANHIKMTAWEDAELKPRQGKLTYTTSSGLPHFLIKGSERIVMELEDGTTFWLQNMGTYIEIRIEEGPYNEAGYHDFHDGLAVVPQFSNSIQLATINRRKHDRTSKS